MVQVEALSVHVRRLLDEPNLDLVLLAPTPVAQPLPAGRVHLGLDVLEVAHLGEGRGGVEDGGRKWGRGVWTCSKDAHDVARLDTLAAQEDLKALGMRAVENRRVPASGSGHA